ncbi:MAG: hypothetical protein WCA13_01045 [Terriglobales bacterium]
MQQLGQDLQSGNLASAQSDFATLQQAFSQPATTSGSSTGSTSGTTTNSVNQAFNQLASDLQFGNLSAAQKDFTTLQSGLKPSGPGSSNEFHHHQHSGSRGGGEDLTNQNSLLQDLSQVGQNLTSGNLSGAQQAYASLQQELQQFALGGTSQSSALLAQPLFSLDA